MEIRNKLNKIVQFLFLRLSKSTAVDGIWIGVFSDENQDEVLIRVKSALALIKEFDENRYKRVVGLFDKIWITYLFGAVGRYIPERRMCQLDPIFVLSSPIEFIASTIVHEATHARLIDVGIPYTYENHHRVEKVCIRQEMVFARRIPEADRLRERIGEKLALHADFWSEEASTERFRYAVETGGGLPKWLRQRLLRSSTSN